MDTVSPAQRDLPVLDPAVARSLPYVFSKSMGIIAACARDGLVELLVRENARCSLPISEARRVLGKPVTARIVDDSCFERYLEEAYSGAGETSEDILGGIELDLDIDRAVKEAQGSFDLLEGGDDAPLVRLINVIMTKALREKASDVHFELYEKRSVVRFRVDGVLHDVVEPQADAYTAIVSRLKVMARLDIAEKRLPQDGRFTLLLAGRPIDVRVSTIPSGKGERVAIRLLDKQGGPLTLNQLGMSESAVMALDSMIRQPHGIILVTGPTGSGKTTTLYAALSRLNVRQLNIMTVEDPVEYELDGVSQTQANPSIGMTFSRALRSILRQDPDVIMIGEIRDLETASIAVQASLTGHLVLATLHTNDSVGAVSRLADMGVERFLLASSLLGVMAQRLVRRICPECREGFKPDYATSIVVGDFTGDEIYRARGCDKCRNTGYAGRSGIFELFQVDDRVRELVHNGESESKIRKHVYTELETNSLRGDGMRLVRKGETSLEEVLRVADS